MNIEFKSRFPAYVKVHGTASLWVVRVCSASTSSFLVEQFQDRKNSKLFVLFADEAQPSVMEGKKVKLLVRGRFAQAGYTFSARIEFQRESGKLFTLKEKRVVEVS